jgi:hypothetical protein
MNRDYILNKIFIYHLCLCSIMYIKNKIMNIIAKYPKLVILGIMDIKKDSKEIKRVHKIIFNEIQMLKRVSDIQK